LTKSDSNDSYFVLHQTKSAAKGPNPGVHPGHRSVYRDIFYSGWLSLGHGPEHWRSGSRGGIFYWHRNNPLPPWGGRRRTGRARSGLRHALLVSLLIISAFALTGLQKAHSSETLVNACGSVSGTQTYRCKPVGTQGNFCMGLSGDIWKDNDEADPNHDIFGADMHIIAHNATTAQSYVVQISNTYFQFPSQAADLGRFDPQTQSVSSQSPVTLAYSGISISLLLPAKSTTAVSSGGGGSGNLTYTWTVNDDTSDEFCLSTCRQGVLGSHADFGTVVQVPEAFSGFTVQFNAQVFVTYLCQVMVDGTTCYGTQYNLSESPTGPDPDFRLSGPASISEAPCSTTVTTTTATADPNFFGNISFSDSPHSGFTTRVSPTSVELQPGSSGSTSYSITAPCNPNAEGTYSWNIIGRTTLGTNLQHSWAISVSVPGISVSYNQVLGWAEGPHNYSNVTIAINGLLHNTTSVNGVLALAVTNTTRGYGIGSSSTAYTRTFDINYPSSGDVKFVLGTNFRPQSYQGLPFNVSAAIKIHQGIVTIDLNRALDVNNDRVVDVNDINEVYVNQFQTCYGTGPYTNTSPCRDDIASGIANSMDGQIEVHDLLAVEIHEFWDYKT